MFAAIRRASSRPTIMFGWFRQIARRKIGLSPNRKSTNENRFGFLFYYSARAAPECFAIYENVTSGGINLSVSTASSTM
jgi:hypothetical protein